MNFKKSKKQVFVNDAGVLVKNKTVYVGNETLPRKVSSIWLSGEVMISAKALVFLSKMRISVFCTYDGFPVASMVPRAVSRLKRRQWQAFPSKAALRRYSKLRAISAKAAKHPVFTEKHSDAQAFRLYEASYMKRLYRSVSKEIGVPWTGKSDMKIMHLWWKFLYGQVEACVVAMGLDPDLGIIHQQKRALVYDVADLLKPLMLQRVLMEGVMPKDFWVANKEIHSLIPALVLSLVLDGEYSELRSRLGRAASHILRTPTLEHQDLQPRKDRSSQDNCRT